MFESSEKLYEKAIYEIKKNHNLPQAIKILTKAVRKTNSKYEKAEYYAKIADCYFEIENWQDAVDNWNKSSEYSYYSFVNFINKAFAENKLGLYDEEEKDYINAINYQSEKYKQYIKQNFEINNDYEKALICYTKAIKNYTGANPAFRYRDRADFYFENEKWQESVDDYNTALKLNHGCLWQNGFKKAFAEHMLKKYDEAEKDYLEHLRKYPKDHTTYNNLALMYQEKFEYNKALNYFYRAIEFAEENSEAYILYSNNKLKCFEEMKKYK